MAGNILHQLILNKLTQQNLVKEKEKNEN